MHLVLRRAPVRFAFTGKLMGRAVISAYGVTDRIAALTDGTVDQPFGVQDFFGDDVFYNDRLTL